MCFMQCPNENIDGECTKNNPVCPHEVEVNMTFLLDKGFDENNITVTFDDKEYDSEEIAEVFDKHIGLMWYFDEDGLNTNGIIYEYNEHHKVNGISFHLEYEKD